MITISKLVAELDNNPNREDRAIWPMPGNGTCDFCEKSKSAGHAIVKEEIQFCDECGYNLVLFLIEHGYKDPTYNEYISVLTNEYMSRIVNLRDHCQSLY